MKDDLVYRLRKRAEIRRQIPSRKSVQEGAPDRIADLLEEAADALRFYEDIVATLRQGETYIDTATVGEVGIWGELPDHKPVAWMCEANNWDTWKPSLCWVKSEDKCFRNWKPLYTAPKGWVELTDKEIFEHEWWDEETAFHVNKYLKEKNT
jgi:hypothetical protein